MDRKPPVLLLAILLLISAACIIPSRAGKPAPAQAADQASPTPPAAPSPTFAEIAIPTSIPAETATPAPVSLSEALPLPPNSKKDPGTIFSEGEADKSGGFTIRSTAVVDELVKFYLAELPKLGWILMYSDANHTGGVTQRWKKDRTYLVLDFGFDDQGLYTRGEYQRIDALDLQNLPQDFPMPEQAEVVRASKTSWYLYIPQDFATVTSFYQQKLASLKSRPGLSGAGIGSCGGDCGDSGSRYPAGVTPMPTATFESRQEVDVVYTLADGNELEVVIRPHQNGTSVYLTLTFKNIEAAGLPEDVPVYPGAVADIIDEGMATFTVKDSFDKIKAFYQAQLTAAGWTPDFGSDSPGVYMQSWKKSGAEVSIMLSANPDSTCLLVISYTAGQP
jgi:hypothetical protein